MWPQLLIADVSVNNIAGQWNQSAEIGSRTRTVRTHEAE